MERSEYSTNLALQEGTKVDSWHQPPTVRHRDPNQRIYGLMAIAVRHPRLFALLTALVVR